LHRPTAWNSVGVPTGQVWRWPLQRIDLLMPSWLNAIARYAAVIR
jgi:hypothetical protein